MANITIPGYDVIAKNFAYCAIADPLHDEEQREIEAINLLLIRKMRIPTENETVDFIIREASDFLENGWDGNPESGAVKGLVSQVPIKILSNFIKDEASPKIIGHFFRPYFPPGSTYFDARFGIMPQQSFGEMLDQLRNSTAQKIDEALTQTPGFYWNFQLRIDNGGLPNLDKLKILLDSGVRYSEVLLWSGQCSGYPEVGEKILGVYEAVKPSGLVDQLRDDSLSVLEHIASSTIRQTIENIMTPFVMPMLAQILERINAPQDEQPNYVEPPLKYKM